MAQYLFNLFIKPIIATTFLNYFFILNQHIFYKIFDVFLIHWLNHSNLSLDFLDSLHWFKNLFISYCLTFYLNGFLLIGLHCTHHLKYFQIYFPNYYWKIKLSFFLKSHLIKLSIFSSFNLILNLLFNYLFFQHFVSNYLKNR